MRTVRVRDIDSLMGPASVKRPVSKALWTENVAINYYELDPGESFAFGYHAHADQEEIFYVLEGTATFETDADGTGSVDANASDDEPSADGDPITVGAGEAIRFGPGEYQRGTNRDDEHVLALAFGAPRDAGETDVRRDCQTCGERTSQTIETTDDRDALHTVCIDCSTETGRFD